MAKSRQPGLTPATGLFHKSYEAVMRNINTFAILLLPSFLFTLSSLVPFPDGNPAKDFSAPFGSLVFPTYGWVAIFILGFIATVLLVFLLIIIQAMLLILELEAAQDKTPGLGHLWELGNKYLLRLFGLAIVTSIYVIGGLILFIIPGLIMIRRYFLAPYLLIDKDLPIGEAMRRSAALTKPHPGAVWGVIGVMLLLSLPGFVPFIGPIVAFVLGALYSVAPAIRYKELKKLS